jgi:hypothetical protein
MSDQKQGVLTFDWALLFYWMMATTAGWLFGWLLWPPIALVTAGVTAGLVQSLVLFRRIPKAWRWILATAIGWLAGLALVLTVVPPGMGALSGILAGTLTGLAQWVLLRRELCWAGWWIAMSAVAWAVGLSLAPSPEAVLLPRVVLSGVMASVIMGITLELLLRHPRPAVESDED